jgi:hypothetical protein
LLRYIGGAFCVWVVMGSFIFFSRMINSQGFITNIGTKGGIPIILAKGNNASTSNDEQRIILQADSSQPGGFVINPSQNALKLQDNVLTQVRPMT